MNNLIYETTQFNNKLLPFYCRELVIPAPWPCSKTMMNWHTSLELICCVSGSCNIIGDLSGIELNKGDIAVVNSNLLHGITTENFFEGYYILIDSEFCFENGINLEEISFNPKITDKDISDSFVEILNLYKSSENARITELRFTVLKMLLTLLKRHTLNSSEIKRINNDTNKIKPIITYLKMHFTENLSLEKIAQDCNISKSYLTHEFKKYAGQSVVDFINLIRCINAQSLIKNGFSVSSAAYSSGYANLSYFTKTYKKYMNAYPSNDKTQSEF